MSRASDDIENIIHSTRAFESIKSGTKKIELKSVSIKNCLDHAIDIFQERAQNKGIKFVVNNLTDLKEPTILAEEVLFSSSVMANIISNAIKFSPPDSQIEFQVLQPKIDGLVLKVVDRGDGMPADMIQNFIKGQNIESRVGTNDEIGTGFGLDIARMIMQSMGGDITIESHDKESFPDTHGTKVSIHIRTA